MIPHQSFITSPDDAGFRQSLSRCRRQGSGWHMCRDTFGGHTKVIVITMVFRERPRHGVAASNSATRRHSQRMKSGQPESFDHFSAITHLVMSLSQQCCLRSHHSLMPPVPHRLNGMCAATTRRRAVSRCAPWPVVDSGPLGPAASSMSPTRFTVLGVKVSASPRRVHRWRTSACPRSSLGCLLFRPSGPPIRGSADLLRICVIGHV